MLEEMIERDDDGCCSSLEQQQRMAGSRECAGTRMLVVNCLPSSLADVADDELR